MSSYVDSAISLLIGAASHQASLFNRVTGICAPLIAANVKDPSSLILAAGGLYVVASVAMCMLPIETRGKQSL